MLYNNLVKIIRRTDPDFDTEKIDRTLEPGEAENELRSRYGLILTRKTDKYNHMKEYRDHLHERGIGHSRIQNLIMASDKPPQDADLDNLAYVLSARPSHAWAVDRAKRAKRVTRDVRKWANAPNRYDIAGVDTPGSKPIRW